MDDQRLYLKPNVQVEPLVDSWYAWAHLIPPATAARNMTHRHLRLMESYLAAPHIHANAVKDPKMAGGPFIDIEGKRLEEIKALRDRTKTERPHLAELSKAIEQLDAMLLADANGYSLHELYKSVPPALRGYVELVYDLNQRPSFRLIEPLLYRSRYYDRSLQSLMLSLTVADDRPFVLSTPRLGDDATVQLQVPFDDASVDDLFRLKSEPMPWSAIADRLDLPAGARDRARSFFTTEPPPPYGRYEGQGVRWRYFGHACILIETQGVSLLFDPVLSYTYESDVSRYTYLDLPDRIDYVLITHNHQDHVLLETLLQLRHKIGAVVVPKSGGGSLQDPSLKLMLQSIGFRNVIELGEMDTLPVAGGGEVCALPFLGEHADLDVRTKAAYLVRLGRHRLLFAADSCNVEPELYEHVHQAIGDVDALFVGMECDGAPLTWLYGPLLTRPLPRDKDHSRRLAGSNYAQAMAIVNRFNCRETYVYAMGQEPWLNYVMKIKYTAESRPIVESNRLIAECQSRGICAERLFGEKEILLG